jgi:hypothetical protein
MQKPGELKKPVRPGALQKDLKKLCSCPGLCLIHGVPKFRAPAKPAKPGEVTMGNYVLDSRFVDFSALILLVDFLR